MIRALTPVLEVSGHTVCDNCADRDELDTTCMSSQPNNNRKAILRMAAYSSQLRESKAWNRNSKEGTAVLRAPSLLLFG